VTVLAELNDQHHFTKLHIFLYLALNIPKNIGVYFKLSQE